MKNLNVIFVIVILSTIKPVFAQNPFGQRIEGVQNCISVSPTNDAGMILSGPSVKGDSICIVKTDKNGSEQWRQSFASYPQFYNNFRCDIKQTRDGGYILINTIQNNGAAVQVLKLDIQSNIQWTQTYDNEGDDMSRKVLYTYDGGFLFLYSNDAITYMVKTDSTGVGQWTNTDTITGYTNFDLDISQTADSGYIYCRKRYLIKYDKEGTEEWRRSTPILIHGRVRELHSGGYIVANDNYGIIERTDADGDTLWQLSTITFIKGLTIDREDNIILAGEKMVKIDTSANIIWQKNLPFEKVGDLYSVEDLYTEPDGSIVLAGHLANHIGFIARYNANGESAYLILITPRDGDRLPVDSQTDISWASPGIGEIKIEWTNEYQKDWILLAQLQDTLGTYAWSTPGSHSLQNIIRISEISNPNIMDENKTGFSIGAKNYDYIAINEIKMYFATDGDGSHNRIEEAAGFYWPGGENATQTAVYEDGPLWGGLVNGDTLVNGSTYNHGLQPGNIISMGVAADPDNPDFGVYKVRPDWKSLPQGSFKDRLEYDWNHWPVHLGAPWVDTDGDGKYNPQKDHPDISGDEMNWMVMNDLDSAKTTNLYGAYPIGVEVQLSIYGYNLNNILKDVVFKKYKYINKGNNTVDSMYFSYWSDVDLGQADNDFVGCDTVLNLLYGYNGTDNDIIYPDAPPAVGYFLLQGPMIRSTMSDSAFAFNQWHQGYKNIKMTATMLYIDGNILYSDPTLRNKKGSQEMWNNMRGRLWDGTRLINPVTGALTNYVVPGDPVSGTGWYEETGWNESPADRRMLMSSGPLTFAPGDSQEVVYAIIMAQGEDRLDSVRKLKQKAAAVRAFYYTGILPTALYGNEDRVTPKQFTLYQNYPNPFNPTTTIVYNLRANYNSPLQVSLKIYDILGREVKTLVNKQQNAGTYKVTFDAGHWASGVYYYQLKAGDFVQTKKMLLLK